MQYTLRNIPRELAKAHRQKARQEGRSLNEITIEALARGVGVQDETPKNHDLDFATGTWVEDPEFEKAIAAQRQIDPKLWK